MAFKREDVAVNTANFGGQPNEYGYSTADTATAVAASGYFNNFSSELKVGDMFRAEVDTGGNRACQFLRVTSNTGGVVATTKFVPS